MTNPLSELDEQIAQGISRLQSAKRAKNPTDLAVEDLIADDYTWLWDFTYQGKPLTGGEIDFLIAFARTGFAHPPSIDYKDRPMLGRPQVQAALHEATKNAAHRWQISANKVGRELATILDGNITDFLDAGPTGIVLKDLTQIDRFKTGAIQEIHEIRNAQGVQIRIKLYDKIAAINTAARIMNLFPKETLQVEITGLEDRLERAMQRVTLEGTVVNEQD